MKAKQIKPQNGHRRLQFEPLETREVFSGSSGAVGPVPGVTAPAGAIVFTPAQSAATIESAIYNAGSGHSFYFQAGTYHDVSVWPPAGDTFTGAQGAVLTSSTEAYAFESSNPNVTISNLGFTGYAPPQWQSVIEAQHAAGWHIDHVSVSGSTYGGIEICEGGQVTNSVVTGNAILGIDVLSTEATSSGVTLPHTDGVATLIQNDLITGNDPSDQNVQVEAGGIKAYGVNNVTINACTIQGNGGSGIWFDTCWAGNVASNNLIASNFAAGVYNEISNGTLIAGNSITSNAASFATNSFPWNGAGIEVDTSTGVTVSGNSLSGNGNGILTMAETRTDSGFAWQLSGVVISGNSVTASTGLTGMLWRNGSVIAGVVTWKGDTYAASGSAAFVENGTPLTLAQWEAYGNDAAAAAPPVTPPVTPPVAPPAAPPTSGSGGHYHRWFW